MPALFDHYVIVDWSAAGQPKTGRDSIWICHRGPEGERCDNPATRHLAKLRLAEILGAAAAHGERVLLGFDFPFGYPAGLAGRLGLKGVPWRALWDEIARLLHDGEDNRNDRFIVAAELNRRISGGRFPFWGCPVRFAHDFLGPRHHGRHQAEALAEKRLIDRLMVGAQPCWKLAYTGSVGSQALTGIPVVRALRDDPRWADRASIWPFETGLGLPDWAQIVFAEVWPSWWQVRPGLGSPRDKAQVRTVATIFAERDRAGELAAWFAGDPALGEEERRQIETEEAWTLGVSGPRPHSKTPSPPAKRGERVGVRGADAASARSPDPHHPIPPDQVRGGATGPSRDAGEGKSIAGYTYLRDPAAIYRRSFALVRAEADLARFPASLRPLAARLAHAAGEVSILDDLAWSRGAATAGRRALAAGAAILADSAMVAAGIARERLPAENPVICTLRDPAIAALAAEQRTTRSAAAVELWRPRLKGAVVAIGTAPTALFRLLEILMAGADRPALVLGFPVGFVGAAEAKRALVGFGRGLRYVTLAGRRGGSALAAAAVNALCGRAPPPFPPPAPSLTLPRERGREGRGQAGEHPDGRPQGRAFRG